MRIGTGSPRADPDTAIAVDGPGTRHRRPARADDPERYDVKPDIHPTYHETQVVCSCGAQFTTRSTKGNGRINAEVCSQCHPFYTGKQKILDIGGRVEKFERRYGKRTPGQSASN
jgi:large subunit ribosomal protein L31